jgi:hypothetical protein
VGFEPLFKSSEWTTGVPGYDQTWRGFGEATRSDALGRFTLSGVSAGQRRLWAHVADEELVAEVALELATGDDVSQDLVLEQRAGIRLCIVDEAGRPLAGWTAHVRRPVESGNWWIRRQVSAADGRVHFADVPRAAEEIFLDVFDPTGAGTSWLACKLRPTAAEQVMTVETRATCSVAGRLVDHLGAPQLGGTLTFHSLHTTLENRVERTPEGEFEQRLAPGPYMLVLQLEATAVKLTRVELEPGQRLELGLLASPPLGSLRIDAPPPTPPGVTPSVVLFAAIDPERSQRFQPVGRAKIAAERTLALFPGRYRVLAQDGSGDRPRAHFVDVQAHVETRLDPWR